MDNTYIEQAIEHYKTNTTCYHIDTLLILPVPNHIDLFIIVDTSTDTFRNVTYDLDKKKRLEKLESIKNKLRTTSSSTSLPVITEVYHSGPESDSDSNSDSSYEEVIDNDSDNEELYEDFSSYPKDESCIEKENKMDSSIIELNHE
jgi:hypothetical protein